MLLCVAKPISAIMWFIFIWWVPLQNGTESRWKLKLKVSAVKIVVKRTDLQIKYCFFESWCCLPASSKVSVQVVTLLQLFWLCVFPSTVLGFSLEDVGCDGSVKHHALLPTAVLILTGLYISRCASQWYNPALLSVVLLSLGSRAANLYWMHLHVFPKDRQSVWFLVKYEADETHPFVFFWFWLFPPPACLFYIKWHIHIFSHVAVY